MTEEDIDRWERLFRHKFPKTEFGPPNEWPALIALARKGLECMRGDCGPSAESLAEIPEVTDWSGAERGKFYTPPPQEPQGEKCTCDDVLSPNWTPDWKCKVHDAPTPKASQGEDCTCVPSDTQDWPLTSGRCPVHTPTEASQGEEDGRNPSPMQGLVERLIADAGMIGVQRGESHSSLLREAAAALERMERRLANQRETIGDFRETIAGLRSELKMTRDEWDYYKEQYRELAGDGMAELVERLRHTRVDALTPIYSLLNEAADALDALAGERRHLEEKVSQYFNANDKLLEAQETIAALRAENERLTKDLKNAVWSDSEECKMLTESNAALRSALEKIAAPIEWAKRNEGPSPQTIARTALGSLRTP